MKIGRSVILFLPLGQRFGLSATRQGIMIGTNQICKEELHLGFCAKAIADSRPDLFSCVIAS